jgi:opacity protein-like surface antigen
MNKKLLLASALALPLIATAQNNDGNGSGTYARFSAGIAIVEDVEGFADTPVDPRIDFDLNLDPGVNIEFAPGYNFNNFVGVELNTGFIWNSLDKIETSGGNIRIEGDLVQIPIMGNAVLRYPTPAGITPFIGGGGGGVYVRLSLDDDGDDDAGDDFFAAYQFFGGVRYQIDEGLSIGLLYKYLHVFSEDEETLITGESSGLGDLTTHSISASVTFEF